MWYVMMNISKGEKSTINGVILTKKEAEHYKKLNKILETFKEQKKAYDRKYKTYYM